MAAQDATVKYAFGGKEYTGVVSVLGDTVTVTSSLGTKSAKLDGNPAHGWAQILMAEIVGEAFRDRRI